MTLDARRPLSDLYFVSFMSGDSGMVGVEDEREATMGFPVNSYDAHTGKVLVAGRSSSKQGSTGASLTAPRRRESKCRSSDSGTLHPEQ